jgi:lipopolysaccharide/colanic/teichoic acid biosynthesis glycosyltransferase
VPVALDGHRLHPPRVLAVAVLMASAARLVLEAPLPSGKAPGRQDWLLTAAFAAVVAEFVGWIAVTAALGWPHRPLMLLGGWGAAVVILLAPEGLRRAELACGTGSRLFFVGAIDQLNDLRAETARRPYLDIVGHHASESAATCDELTREVRMSRATVLILSDGAIRSPEVVEAATRVNLSGIRVRDLRSFYEQQFDKVAVCDLSLSWFLFDIAAIHKRRLYGLVKQGIEAVVSFAVLAACVPLIPLIALAIKLSSPGPLLFRQPRVGRDGEIFTLAKFRTMHPVGVGEHGQWAGASPDRIFAVGRFLRRVRLDELPQLVSVVRGRLSLVGPRPEQPEIAARLETAMRYYHARHAVRPGLTGWAQIHLGYAASDAGALAKLQYDLFYIKRQSLRLDLRIIASTARAIIFGSGS